MCTLSRGWASPDGNERPLVDSWVSFCKSKWKALPTLFRRHRLPVPASVPAQSPCWQPRGRWRHATSGALNSKTLSSPQSQAFHHRSKDRTKMTWSPSPALRKALLDHISCQAEEAVPCPLTGPPAQSSPQSGVRTVPSRGMPQIRATGTC